jgi:hypothetical protein
MNAHRVRACGRSAPDPCSSGSTGDLKRFARSTGQACIVLTAALLCTTACEDAASDDTSRDACTACRIVLEPVVRLDFRDAPGSLSARHGSFQIAHSSDLSRFLVRTDRVALPMVFGGDGRFIATLGTEGTGPGEYTRAGARALVIDGSDSLRVYTSGRADVYGPDLILGRSYAVQRPRAVAALPDGGLLIQAGGATPIFEVLDAAGAPASRMRSGDSLDFEPPGRLFAVAPSGGFWVARFNDYDLLHVSLAGDTLARHRPHSDWWRAPDLDDAAAGFLDPRPALLGLSADDHVVWVFAGITVPDAEVIRLLQASGRDVTPELRSPRTRPASSTLPCSA